ncbi:MAG TPA: hypothetical protein DEO40_02135 [Treponema sp.]|jgi:hypothetical protein|nr:hypothetical protein [Treponema sp.]HCA19460.1 hypothetical protein [Treponema sp.]
MKKCVLFFALCLVFLPAVSQTSETASSDAVLVSEDGEALDPVTGFPSIKEKPFVMFDWGATMSWNTRLKFQTGRTNFVFEDNMVGLYFTMETMHIRPLDSILRIAAYYPLRSTFNKVEQKSKQTLVYAFDVIFAPLFRLDMWHYIGINIAPGIHFMYQLTDDWHYFQLGGSVLAGIELPVWERWTFLINGIAALDYPNFGTNAQMAPIDLAWSYQLSVGVRYSKKGANKYSYIKSRRKAKAAREARSMETAEASSPEYTAPQEEEEQGAE